LTSKETNPNAASGRASRQNLADGGEILWGAATFLLTILFSSVPNDGYS